MLRCVWAFGLVTVMSVGCGQNKLGIFHLAGLGDPCEATGDCRLPLLCDAVTLTCEPSHAVPEGEFCVLSADCEPGLYCAADACAQAGEGEAGQLCTSTADCRGELVCAYGGFGASCHPGGDGDLKDRCDTTADCVPALICDPVKSRCVTQLSEPAGTVCNFESDCASDLGIYCLRENVGDETGVCGGVGPDGVPIPPWDGIDCSAEETGTFRVLFEVGSTSEDFFRLPFPNDIRIQSGLVDLAGFPRPPLYASPSDVMTRYVAAIEAEQDGFGPNQTVFLRTSHRPLFCASGCDTIGTCADGCMGRGEPAASIYAVDLTDNGFIGYLWQASSGNLPYICGPWIAVTPTFTAPWKPGHTYAVFVHSRIKGADDEAMTQDADFAAMLSTSAPGDARLTDAWTVYQPLRDWLALEPTYSANTPIGTATQGQACTDTADCDTGLYCAPGNTCENEGSATWEQACVTTADCVRGLVCHPTHSNCQGPVIVQPGDLGGAAVFTPRDPTRLMTALGTEVEAVVAFPTTNLVDCTDPTSDPVCWDTAAEPFFEVQGLIGLPSFQEGTAPYLDSGGNIAVDGTGVPQLQATVDVRFSLTIPTTGAVPGTGWPVVIYAHGTGGDYQSHVRSTGELTTSIAALFANATTLAAVLGIDQLQNGERRGGSELPADTLFSSFANPPAAKGNMLQAAADQMSLVRAISDLSGDVETLLGAAAPLLDPTKVAFVGHSQGGTSGTLGMARSADTRAAVLSGAGGGWLDTFTSKTSPYDLAVLVRWALADRTIREGWPHPALSLMQGYLEDADPVSYGLHVSADPLIGSVSKHVLQVVGIDDTYTPDKTARHLARRLAPQFFSIQFYKKTGEGIFVDDDGTGFATPVATTNVQGNFLDNGNDLTIAVTVHEPATDRDGHFVLFDIANASDRMERFVSDYLADPTSVPTVPLTP